ncbi:MAG: SusC/RagA family TonB-linked outer membrane protein [Bacteroidales bacterium]|nr:SusC/RagA family TonB-linked outer membrane protein [Bacteroidales bacterium]
MKSAKNIFLLAGALTAFSFNAFSQDLNTAAIATATGEEIYTSPTPNFTEALSGKVPGLTVITRDATPGAGSARMLIRGLGSYAEGTENNTLKIYVDGFEVKSDFINYLIPEEIESVSILKDAAALATYGMNGANGVIFIKTKRGEVTGKPIISFQARTGLQAPVNVAKPLGSYDFAQLYNQAYSNDHGREWDPYYDFEAVGAWKNGTGVDVRWYDEVMKNNGMYSDAVLSFRGGSALTKYSVVLDYGNQQGLLNVRNTPKTHNASYEQFGLRTNLDIRLNKVLTVSVDVGGRLEDRTRPDYSLYSLMDDIMNYPSNIYPITDPLATDPISNYSGTAIYPNNPVASLKGIGWTTSRTKLMLANFKFKEELDFIARGLYLQEGFSFYSKTIGNTAKTNNYARYFDGEAQTSDKSSYLRSEGYWSSGKERWMQGDVTLGWANVFDLHAFDAALSAHISDYNGSGSEFYNWKYHYINYSGRVNYSYNNRYIAGLGFSYFGSDAYAKDRRFVFYPTVSFAWVASNEDFFDGKGTVDYLKVRTSAGMSGASEAYVGIDGFLTDGRYLYQQYYGWTGSYVKGVGPGFGGGESGIRPLFKANPDITAEKSLKANLGIDLKLFGKLDVTADYFIDNRTGILTLDQTIMEYRGIDACYSNLGRMLYQGIDASFDYPDSAGDFRYSVVGGVLFAKNKVLEMGEVGAKYAYNRQTGHPYGTRMGLECEGFYKVTDFDLDGELNMGLPVPLFGAVQPGDLKYKDQDGDGYIDETDVVAVGAPSYPCFTFSLGAAFEYKGFDLSLLLAGNAGSSVNLLDYRAWRTFEDYGNAFEWAKGAWGYYPEAGIDTRNTASYPRLSLQSNDNNYRNSSFWIRDNSYLRLQNIELGYELSTLSAFRNAGITKCRVYVNAYNLLTISSLLAECKMDPATVNYGYPNVKSFNLGVQLTF